MENSRVLGLTSQEVKERVSSGLVNVTNTNISKSTKDIIRTHTLTYFNFLNIFLGVIVVLSGQIKNLTFLGVIIINSIIGIIQELKVKSLVDQLTVITATKAAVRRDGEIKDIPITELVIDDVLIVKSGNQIGSDSVVLSSSGIEVNESMLTGESKPVKKFAGDTLLSGSYLVAGSGEAKVIHVGEENYATALSNQAKNKKRATSEMQDSIKRIIKVIGIIIIPVGILLFLAQRGVAETTLSDAMVNTVAGIVGMIPEGLVLLTSISFILGVGRLAKKRALVQEMEAIEALARVNTLCTDKTGTITTGELVVEEVVVLDQKACENIRLIMGEIAHGFNDVNQTQEALINHFEQQEEWEIKDLIPFSSERKYRAISFFKYGSYVLGAPEFILNDEVELEMAREYSKKGLRVLLLAETTYVSSRDNSYGDIKPLAFILISDCVREDARETFEYFANQNVAVKVISGDNPVTVSHVAVEVGLQDGDKYIDATTLPQDQEDLREAVRGYTVFGRVTPEQKQKIIKAYQDDGKVVGMIGDGVNDVLALKDADCGIAMAAGSDAAKQVAHIVLLDSDFASMKDIVKEGRMIISNIERVSALYLTKTMYSVLLSVIFIFLGASYPFIPIHLSLISATAIGIPSFILALEQTEAVTQNGFLKHVLRVSLPGALTLVANILFIQLIRGVLDFSDELVSTYNLLVAGLISMQVLMNVCKPLNKRRQLLCQLMIVLFVVVILFLPGVFNIETIFAWRMIFIIPILFLTYPLMRGLSYMIGKCIDNL